MLPTDIKLARIRDEIDAVDDRILDLVLQRAELVKAVADAKQESGTLDRYIRPGREAAILRRLVSRNAGRFPVAALVRIWRELLCSLLPLQGNFSVIVGGEGAPLWDTARDYYGSDTIMFQTDSGKKALDDVRKDRVEVAVVPVDDAPAISDLVSNPSLWIIGKLPFVSPRTGAGERRTAYVVSRQTPDNGKDDIAVIGILGAAALRNEVPELQIFESCGLLECAYDLGDASDRQLNYKGQSAVLLGSFAAPLKTPASQP